jgi:hypothetical protein
MEGSGDGAWSRALLASSGVTMHGSDDPHHASAQLREARAEDTPRVRLRALATARDPDVREAVARRSDCPVGALASLAHDRKDDVRVAVAANPSAGRAIIEHLMHDRSSSVLAAIARNPATDRDLLESLAVHRREEVRRVAARELDGGLREVPAPIDEPHLPPELRDRSAAAAEPATASDRVLAPRPSVPSIMQAAHPPTVAGWIPGP